MVWVEKAMGNHVLAQIFYILVYKFGQITLEVG